MIVCIKSGNGDTESDIYREKPTCKSTGRIPSIRQGVPELTRRDACNRFSLKPLEGTNPVNLLSDFKPPEMR